MADKLTPRATEGAQGPLVGPRAPQDVKETLPGSTWPPCCLLGAW